MITRIGIVAGEIWNFLDHPGKVAQMDDIIKSLNRDRDIALMSLGWLAREGHIVLEGAHPNYTIRLTKESSRRK